MQYNNYTIMKEIFNNQNNGCVTVYTLITCTTKLNVNISFSETLNSHNFKLETSLNN